MSEIDSFGFAPKAGPFGLSATDRLFGNIHAARLLLAETTTESFDKNKVRLERILEHAASWFSQVVPLDDVGGHDAT